MNIAETLILIGTRGCTGATCSLKADELSAIRAGARAWEIVQMVLAVQGTPADHEWRAIHQAARSVSEPT